VWLTASPGRFAHRKEPVSIVWLIGHRSGLVLRLTMVVAILVHSIDIRSMTGTALPLPVLLLLTVLAVILFRTIYLPFFFVNTEVL
jgi:hypothetical protein